MKSLEYVKKIREDLNQCFRYGNPATLNNEHEIYRKEWETIKQDLEVLEILRKYLYLSGFEGDEDYPRDLELEIGDYGHCINQDIEEYEDYKKVKQWLEENE